MRASNTYDNGGSKATKIAIVTALHIGVAIALIHMKGPVAPPLPPLVMEPITPPIDHTPPPEPEVDTTPVKMEPTIYVPKTEIVTAPPPPDFVAPRAEPLPPGPPPAPTTGGARTGTGTGDGQVAAAKKPYTIVGQGECARPDYPASAARNGETGTVSLALLIGTNGKVAEARIEKTSGSKVLDRAAVAALQDCKFKPATDNGVAEPAWGRIAYVWSLD